MKGHRTSVALEPSFWAALDALAAYRGIATSELIVETDLAREGNLASALRCLALDAARRGHIQLTDETDTA